MKKNTKSVLAIICFLLAAILGYGSYLSYEVTSAYSMSTDNFLQGTPSMGDIPVGPLLGSVGMLALGVIIWLKR